MNTHVSAGRIAVGQDDLARVLESCSADVRLRDGSRARGIIADPHAVAAALFAHLDTLRAESGESRLPYGAAAVRAVAAEGCARHAPPGRAAPPGPAGASAGHRRARREHSVPAVSVRLEDLEALMLHCALHVPQYMRGDIDPVIERARTAADAAVSQASPGASQAPPGCP